MKIELKNLKINLAFSEETTMFKADLYVNGVKIGYADNDGRGGCTNYGIDYSKNPSYKEVLVEAEAYCKALPPVTYKHGDKSFEFPMNLEHFIDDLVEKECRKKEDAQFAKKLQANMLKGLVYGTSTHATTITWKGHTIASMLTSVQGRMTLTNKILELTKEGHKILNTNLPEVLNLIGNKKPLISVKINK